MRIKCYLSDSQSVAGIGASSVICKTVAVSGAVLESFVREPSSIRWMDGFIYAEPSRTICSIQQLYINVGTCVLRHFLNELRASLGPAVAS